MLGHLVEQHENLSVYRNRHCDNRVDELRQRGFHSLQHRLYLKDLSLQHDLFTDPSIDLFINLL